MKTGISKGRLYLDVCTLSRPFDDQTMMRIRLETDAFYLILKGIQNGIYEMAVSPVHLKEIERIRDEYERSELIILLDQYAIKSLGNLSEVRKRAASFYSAWKSLEIGLHFWGV